MQLVADELDVPMSAVKHIQSDTWYTPDQGTTAGSQSTGTQNGHGRRAPGRRGGPRSRCSTWRRRSSGAPVASLTVSNGVVSVAASQSVSYAALIGGKPFNLLQTGKATPKPYTAYKIVGHVACRGSTSRTRCSASSPTRRTSSVPGMLHARVVRPPTLDSTLV